MQGKNRFILDSFDKIKNFTIKLASLIEEVNESDFFQILNAESIFKTNDLGNNSNFNLKSFSDFLKKLQANFEERFSDFENQDNFDLFSKPFSIKRNKIPVYFQDEIRELRKLNLEIEFNKCNTNEQKMNFFKQLPDQFSNFKNNLTTILSMFPSYLCGQFFSLHKFCKNQYSSIISPDNLQSCLRIASSESEPNYHKLINE